METMIKEVEVQATEQVVELSLAELAQVGGGMGTAILA